MCDVPVVAGGARNRGAGLSAVLREGGGGSGAMHGVEWPGEDARHNLSTVVEMGETVMAAKKPFGGGVIMPHVVTPEVAGGEVSTPPIVQEQSGADLERVLSREEREDVLEWQFQKRIEEFYEKALPLVKNRRIGTRQLQQALGIGYRHACQIVILLEGRGIIDRM